MAEKKNVEKPLTEQPVARADRRDDVSGQEGVNPIVVNPDQPAFPRPAQVEKKDLEKMGVAHGYTRLGDEPDADAIAGVDPDTGTREGVKVDAGTPQPGPEGKPQDPDVEAKNKAANKVAKAADKK